MKAKNKLITVIILAAILTLVITGCSTMGKTSTRTAEHQDWETLLKSLYPDAQSLNIERFRTRWGAVVEGDTVTFDGTNYHDFVYVFPANVTLADYAGMILVMEIFDIYKPAGSNVPTRNVTFSIRKGPTEVTAAEDNYNARKIKQFWAADDADFFSFVENGILVVGISGEQYTNLINDPVHGGGINIHNSIWGPSGSHLNRTAYSMKMHSFMLLPKRDTSAFGSRGSEYILDHTAFYRSRHWGGNDSVCDILMMNNNGSVGYDFPGGVNVSSYRTLEINYRVLDNSGGDMTVTVRANNLEGVAIGTYTLENSGTLRVPLNEMSTGFAIRNNVRRSANSANYVLKIDSLKLVNN